MSGRGRSRTPRTSNQELPDFDDGLPTDQALRRRGRPRGQNRRALSNVQKKRRNNFYEKIRRDTHKLLYNQLAEGLHIDTKMSQNNILMAAIQRFKQTEDVTDLQRINEKLQNQITLLLRRLGDDVDLTQLDSDSDDDPGEISGPLPQRRNVYDSGVGEDEASTSSSSASVSVETSPERQEEFEAGEPSQLEEICSLIPNGVYDAIECETLILQRESPLGPLPEGAEGCLSDIFDLQPFIFPEY